MKNFIYEKLQLDYDTHTHKKNEVDEACQQWFFPVAFTDVNAIILITCSVLNKKLSDYSLSFCYCRLFREIYIAHTRLCWEIRPKKFQNRMVNVRFGQYITM